ncbi:MAG: hypothetical protein JWQ35_1619 [Bacteriovoracaceae bacterium]|nr:hypothetical protein [Bacteriovoracaceae bacterium]
MHSLAAQYLYLLDAISTVIQFQMAAAFMPILRCPQPSALA